MSLLELLRQMLNRNKMHDAPKIHVKEVRVSQEI